MTAKSTDRKIKFQEGEQVLCYHGPLIYEAKCIKIRTTDQIEYLIHYSGWNKSWDEWVKENRLLTYNEENLLKKSELDKTQKAHKKSSKRRTSIGSIGEKDDNSRSNSPKPSVLFARKSVSTLTTQITRIKFDKQQEITSIRKNKNVVPLSEVEFCDYITITILLPEDLQNLLLYDLELVSKRKRVTKIPARISVSEITDNYISHKTSVSEENSRYKETALAMKNYFDLVLPTKLLYAFEKPQYEKMMETKTVLPSSMYSVIHFIRMFTKLGQLLAHLQIDCYSINLIEENINDYVRYLNLNINKFICIDDYQATTVDYQRNMKS